MSAFRTINPTVVPGQMPCIGLWQPWASFITWDEKRFETRGWRTDYRGRIAILAAKKWDREIKDWCCEQPHRKVICAHLDISQDVPDYWFLERVRERMMFGAIVATARIADCISTDRELRLRDAIRQYGARYEFKFGDYSVERFAWRLEDVEALAEPIPFTGRQGWFNVPESVLRGDREIAIETVAPEKPCPLTLDLFAEAV